MVRATGALAVLELPYCRIQYYLLPPVYKCFALQEDTYVTFICKQRTTNDDTLSYLEICCPSSRRSPKKQRQGQQQQEEQSQGHADKQAMEPPCYW